MWRMQSGNRVLSPAEWACFCQGLGHLRDSIESDLEYDSNDHETGIAIFDRLSAEQKLALLAEVSLALTDPTIQMPRLTAANEGAIAAVLRTFWFLLCLELENERHPMPEIEITRDYRSLLLAACAYESESPDCVPLSETDETEWSCLYEEFESYILWDDDFSMADDLLDLPPDEMESRLRFLTIERDYFVTVPHEPNPAELIAARQVLARMIGVPVIDDEGLYPFLDDLYHGLAIGPCPESAIAVWQDNPWVQVARCTTPNWECSYEIWQTDFFPAIPTQPFAIDPDEILPAIGLSAEVTIEQLDDQWVVRDRQDGYWCSLLDNGWTDSPNSEEPALSFPSEAEAVSAFLQADRMYDERAERRRVVLERLGRPDQV
ncbi:hypothetical protein GC163_08330 [bacterium]|nr:hypothetical protein [bacterium]